MEDIWNKLDLNGYGLRINGNVKKVSADIDLNGGTMTVDKDLRLADAAIYFNGGGLWVNGNFMIESPDKDTDGTNKPSYGWVKMEDPKDKLIVGGNIEAKSFNTSVMSAGTIQVGGDINDVKGNTMRASGDMTIKTNTITTEGKTETTPATKPTQAPKSTQAPKATQKPASNTNTKTTATPAQVTVKKAEPGASSLTISWTPLTKDCTGYEIQVSTDKDFKNASTYTASGASASSHIINGLTATTVYYYRIRAINGTVTGSWSEGQSVKTTAVVKTPTATPTPAPAKGDKIEYYVWETAHTFRSSSTLYLFEVKNGDWAGRKKVPAENWKITEKDIDVKSATLTPTKDGGCILNVSIGTNPFTENYVNVSCTYKGKTYTGAAYFDEIMLQDSAELAQDLYNEVVPVLPIN